ncbi:MAG: SIS domain-containing protein [Thiotrichaceae bacterium]|nr:SIS domain-containing protein [Thiotrichaceae bacterium]
MASFIQLIDEHTSLIDRLKHNTQAISTIEKASTAMIHALANNKKILFCGNGGSAADSQHLAAELVVRFETNRRALPAIALTANSSTLTAHSNDIGFETVFSRQVEALGQAGDVLIAISTSGASNNIIKAVQAANEKDMMTIAMTGSEGNQLAELANIAVKIPSNTTARIQEAHIMVGHWWCQQIDQHVTEEQ